METWCYTLVGLTMLFIVSVGVSFVIARGASRRMVFIVFLAWLIVGFLSAVVSKRAIVSRLGLIKIDDKHPRFTTVAEELSRHLKMKVPDLYLLPTRGANAFAFGLGIFDKPGVAITQELYDLLDDEEIQGVVAHEYAHIRCRDIGLLMVMQIIKGYPYRLAASMVIPIIFMFKGAALAIPGIAALILTVLLFPIGVSAVSVEREYTADLLAAKFCRSTKGLKSALQKICSTAAESIDNPFSGLFISHPNLPNRIMSLEELEIQSPSTERSK
jgi:heat shock protein HtpX